MGAFIILAVVLGSVVRILSASWGWHSSLPSERLIVVIRRTLSGLAEIAVDMLPDDELEIAERVLAGLSVLSLSNPATAALAKAPVDDEPVTAREAEAIEEGERDFERGRVVAADELRARLGP